MDVGNCRVAFATEKCEKCLLPCYIYTQSGPTCWCTPLPYRGCPDTTNTNIIHIIMLCNLASSISTQPAPLETLNTKPGWHWNIWIIIHWIHWSQLPDTCVTPVCWHSLHGHHTGHPDTRPHHDILRLYVGSLEDTDTGIHPRCWGTGQLHRGSQSGMCTVISNYNGINTDSVRCLQKKSLWSGKCLHTNPLYNCISTRNILSFILALPLEGTMSLHIDFI